MLCVAVTLLLVVAMHRRAPHLNGPSYWMWSWRRLPVTRSYLPFLLAALPTAGALWLHRRWPERVWTAVRLVMLATILLGLLVVSAGTLDWSDHASAAILDPGSHGYFSDAYDAFVRSGGMSVRRFLAEYPNRMPGFSIHGTNKPPGPILFDLIWIRLMPTRASAASAAAIAIVVLASLSVPTTFLMVRRVTGAADAALFAAVGLSLCPGFLLFQPGFDSIYPVFSCALVMLWAESLRRGGGVWPVALGAAFAAVTFQTYNLLTTGAVFAVMGAWAAYSGRRRVRAVVAASVVSVLAFAATELVIRLSTGLDPLRTFRVALADTHAMFVNLRVIRVRTLPRTIPWDLADFALGMGWIALIPLAGFFVARGRSMDERAAAAAMVALPLTVACLGLIRAETARCWIFMMPLLMFPVGRELARWRPGARDAFFACEWVLLATVFRTMFLHS